MSSFLSGCCLCGALRYEYRGAIGPVSMCHCSDCRKTSGSAFGVSIELLKDSFELTSGDAAAYEMEAESGNRLTRHFCPHCGSPIYTSSPSHPDHVYLEAGSLDEPHVSELELSHQSWTNSAVKWGQVPPGLPSYETSRTD